MSAGYKTSKIGSAIFMIPEKPMMLMQKVMMSVVTKHSVLGSFFLTIFSYKKFVVTSAKAVAVARQANDTQMHTNKDPNLPKTTLEMTAIICAVSTPCKDDA